MPGEMTTATHHPVDLTAGDGEDIEVNITNSSFKVRQ